MRRSQPLPALLLLFLLLGILTVGCRVFVNDLTFHVSVADLDGLKEDDRVYFKDYPVGRVTAITVRPEGDFLVTVCIKDAQRAAAARNHYFIIDRDPKLVGHQAIIIKQGAPGPAVPLKEGETVAGSGSLDYLLHKNRDTLRETSEQVDRSMERFVAELKRLPESEEYRELRRLVREMLEDLLNEGERRFKDRVEKDVLPEIQRRIEEFRRQLPGLGEGSDKDPEPEPVPPPDPHTSPGGTRLPGRSVQHGNGTGLC
jgi:hypothetical protein